ncbi:MAG: amino acid adenylation domain-containing protein [Flavobacteriales bacterium]|nr:amino acid adenylation domain-containing protein [Flavobacteriales bacterium]
MSTPRTTLFQNFTRFADRPAFYIADRSYSYLELEQCVNAVRSAVKGSVPETELNVGIYASDHIMTYASILALWAEGRSYVPLDPGSPKARNMAIIENAGISIVLSAGEPKPLDKVKVVRTDELTLNTVARPLVSITPDTIAYILFTSGTTGQPKGVPIDHRALSAFTDAFDHLGYDFGPEDRCLQMFDLTFDLSVMSYMLPLLKGACVYTIPKDELKYTYIHSLLEDHALTVALMVPSILGYLRPYFDEIDCPQLKLNLFCGEALTLEVVDEWSRCVPNATIMNVYGPTEHTIFCTEYRYDRTTPNKERNGVLSIGIPMHGTCVVLRDMNGTIVGPDEQGELCLSGAQATKGYWNDPDRTNEAFFDHEGIRYYRTGDLCEVDADKDILYIGRTDQQVKIQGFRVELADLEHHARKQLERQNAVAVALVNQYGITELGLVVEGPEVDAIRLVIALRNNLPEYMLPRHIMNMEVFPLNQNGKIDRRAIREFVVARTT